MSYAHIIEERDQLRARLAEVERELGAALGGTVRNAPAAVIVLRSRLAEVSGLVDSQAAELREMREARRDLTARAEQAERHRERDAEAFGRTLADIQRLEEMRRADAQVKGRAEATEAAARWMAANILVEYEHWRAKGCPGTQPEFTAAQYLRASTHRKAPLASLADTLRDACDALGLHRDDDVDAEGLAEVLYEYADARRKGDAEPAVCDECGQPPTREHLGRRQCACGATVDPGDDYLAQFYPDAGERAVVTGEVEPDPGTGMPTRRPAEDEHLACGCVHGNRWALIKHCGGHAMPRFVLGGVRIEPVPTEGPACDDCGQVPHEIDCVHGQNGRSPWGPGQPDPGQESHQHCGASHPSAGVLCSEPRGHDGPHRCREHRHPWVIEGDTER